MYALYFMVLFLRNSWIMQIWDNVEFHNSSVVTERCDVDENMWQNGEDQDD